MNSFSKKFDAELYYLRGINQRFLKRFSTKSLNDFIEEKLPRIA